jgi:hypothetical protein
MIVPYGHPMLAVLLLVVGAKRQGPDLDISPQQRADILRRYFSSFIVSE